MDKTEVEPMEVTQSANEGASRPQKTVVLPGEEISLNGASAGPGTYTEGGRVFASLVGLKIVHGGVVSVVPLSGVYSAHQGDTVIGNCIDTGPSNWTLDIKTSQPCSLHVNDVPWKVDFGDTSRYVAVGESVLCRVLKVDELKRVFITLSGPGLRKLEGGQVIEVPHSKVSRIAGRKGETLEKLKKWTNCRIVPAANGRVWVDGDPADIKIAVEAIRLIEREADAPDLSLQVAAFLSEHGHEPKAPAEGGSGFGTEGDRARGGSEADEDAETARRERLAEEE
jgi:exosome complex component RRP4